MIFKGTVICGGMYNLSCTCGDLYKNCNETLLVMGFSGDNNMSFVLTVVMV